MLWTFAIYRIDLFYFVLTELYFNFMSHLSIFLEIEYYYGFWLILFYEIKLYFYVVFKRTLIKWLIQIYFVISFLCAYNCIWCFMSYICVNSYVKCVVSGRKSCTGTRPKQSPVQDCHVSYAVVDRRMRPPFPSHSYPQHGKLFPDIGINTNAHPSATLFAPLHGVGRQKFCQPGSVLRTQRSSTFSCILKWRCGEKSRI